MRHSPGHGERMTVIKDVLAYIDDTTRHERRVSDLYSATLRFHHSVELSADKNRQANRTAHASTRSGVREVHEMAWGNSSTMREHCLRNTGEVLADHRFARYCRHSDPRYATSSATPQ